MFCLCFLGISDPLAFRSMATNPSDTMKGRSGRSSKSLVGNGATTSGDSSETHEKKSCVCTPGANECLPFGGGRNGPMGRQQLKNETFPPLHFSIIVLF